MSDGARPDMGIFRMIASATVVLLACIVAVISAQAGDSHAEYYYPEPQSRETYASPVKPLATVNKRSRIGFTVGLNEQQLKRSYDVTFKVCSWIFYRIPNTCLSGKIYNLGYIVP